MAKPTLPRPTDGKLSILRVLWGRGPSTVRQVHEILSRDRPGAYTTTLKLLQIMVRARSQPDHLAQLSTLDEPRQRLDIRAIAVVVRHAHHAPGFGRRRKNALHAA